MPSVATNYSPCQELFRIRWVMMYANGTARRGLWSMQGRDRFTLASMQPRENLVAVGVEGLDLKTKKTIMLHQVPAEGFDQFKIEYATTVPAFTGKFLDKVGALKVHGKVWGLSILFHNKPGKTIRTDGSVTSK